MIDAFALHDTVMMKKPHACGGNAWEIVRVGADVKIKCLTCGHIVMMDRAEFVKKAKKRLSVYEPPDTERTTG